MEYHETLPKPINYGGVQPGINVELEQYDQLALEETLSQIKAAGFMAVKQPFFFEQSFDWTASDRIVEAVTEHELTLVLQLDGQPAEAFAPPADLNVFAEWAGEFARRYGNIVDHYIVWDEPNLTSHWGNQPVNPLAYAALLTAASQTIRAADADAAIVVAPLAPTEETGPKNLADPLFLQGLYEAGATDAFDIVAAKPYGFDTGPEDRRVDIGRLNFSRTILLARSDGTKR